MNRRHVILCIMILWQVLPITRADTPSTKPAIANRLDERIDLSLDGLTIDQAIRAVAEKTHLNLIPGWRLLEDGGVSRTKKLTGGVVHTTVRAALQLALGEAGLNRQARIAVDGDLVRIDGELVLETRVYDVSKIIESFRKDWPAWQDKEEHKDRDQPGQTLERILLKTVAPGTWADDRSDGHGTANVIGTRLIVQQTPDVWPKLEAMLRQLETPRAE